MAPMMKAAEANFDADFAARAVGHMFVNGRPLRSRAAIQL